MKIEVITKRIRNEILLTLDSAYRYKRECLKISIILPHVTFEVIRAVSLSVITGPSRINEQT